MLDEHVDLVAGDFNEAAWRRQCGNGRISFIEEAFADSYLLMPPGPTPLWSPGAVPGTWSDVCGFLKLPDSDECWKVRHHGAFSIPYEALHFRSKGASCHEVWLHVDFVDHHSSYEPRENTNNGFSSKKDLLRTNPARKGARQMKTKATVRFRPKRRRPFASVTIVLACNAAPMSTIQGTHVAVHQALRSVTG